MRHTKCGVHMSEGVSALWANMPPIRHTDAAVGTLAIPRSLYRGITHVVGAWWTMVNVATWYRKPIPKHDMFYSMVNHGHHRY